MSEELTDIEISKTCAELMGYRFHPTLNMPDFINNKSDAYDLIQFVVNEWDGWEKFKEAECYPNGGVFDHRECTPDQLLHDQRNLPEALAIYLKEEGE